MFSHATTIKSHTMEKKPYKGFEPLTSEYPVSTKRTKTKQVYNIKGGDMQILSSRKSNFLSPD